MKVCCLVKVLVQYDIVGLRNTLKIHWEPIFGLAARSDSQILPIFVIASLSQTIEFSLSVVAIL